MIIYRSYQQQKKLSYMHAEVFWYLTTLNKFVKLNANVHCECACRNVTVYYITLSYFFQKLKNLLVKFIFRDVINSKLALYHYVHKWLNGLMHLNTDYLILVSLLRFVYRLTKEQKDAYILLQFHVYAHS